MYTVYRHTNKLNNKIYIGITGRNPETRWAKGKGYKPRNGNQSAYFYNAVLKYGWDNFSHEILYTELTKQEAEKIEVELIKKFNSNNREFGYNIDNGGNSVGKLSQETKEKLSKSWEIGKEERCKKISEGSKGKKFTKEHRLHLSEAKKGKPANNRKSVIQYDLNMNFIKRWDSLEDAQRETKVCKANICRAIKYSRTAGGYKWTY
jgi:group I intron endonuclease